MADKPTTAWDPTEPTGARDASEGDDRMREFKTQMQELFGEDHRMENTAVDPEDDDDEDQGEMWGYHKVARFVMQAANPDTIDEVLQLYQKDVSAEEDRSETELFVKLGDGTVKQLTSGGIAFLDQTYETGTADVAQHADLARVDGTDTAWLTNVSAGDIFNVTANNRFYEIAAVVNNGRLTLAADYEHAAGAGVDYRIGKIVNPLKHLLPAAGKSLFETLLKNCTIAGTLDMDSKELENIKNGNIATAALAANAVGRAATYQNATSNQTTSASSYGDMPNMSVSLTTSGVSGSFVIVDFDGVLPPGNANKGFYARIAVDGTGKAESAVRCGKVDANDSCTAHISYIVTGLSAASHTFKVEWMRLSGSMNGEIENRHLRVFEIKK